MILNDKKEISMFGIASDLGGAVAGASLGPIAIRYAGLNKNIEEMGYSLIDEGDLKTKYLFEQKKSSSTVKYIDDISDLSKRSCEKVSSIINKNKFPLILGGDHSLSIGTIAGVREHYDNLGVIWVDAHGDVNTEKTTPSGNIHGMPVAVNLGYGHDELISIGKGNKLKPENLVYIAIRDLDKGEMKILKDLNVSVFTMKDIDVLGINEVMKQAREILEKNTDGIHLSFDIDSVDPMFAMGTGTKVAGGLTVREARYILEEIADIKNIVSAEFVEVNPLIDHDNNTAKLTVSLISSFLGKTLI